MIGTLFNDRYRIEADLGRGGMGAVYRAYDTLLERYVALKLLGTGGAAVLDTQARARLLHEARAAARLNHPNIVIVFDAGEADGLPFIVMELVEGPPLSQVQFPSLEAILAIAAQVCQALEHAHAHGVIHRDLKPGNILIAPGEIAKLSDFGLARSTASRLTTEGSIVGTVFYLPPEQAMGQPVDARTDLYALGVILYELVTGRLPFLADDPLAVISQHLYAPVVPPSTFNPAISPALDALILRLLSKQPQDRPSSALEVRQALDVLESIQAPPLATPALSLIDRIVLGRLVGRDRELAEAQSLWQKACAGESSVLLISGEPGIGKTRLARELIAQAQVQGAMVLLGECYAEGGAPYAPVAQMAEAALEMPTAERLSIADLPGFSDLLLLVPSLRGRFPAVPERPPLEPPVEQPRLFESVVELCAALSAQLPLLVVLEDAHWADSGTLSLLRHLARRAPRLRLRLLIVFTYREVELDEARALNDVLYDLNRERLAARLKLARLDRQQTRDLLAAMFAEEVTPEFLEGIYRETEGNPFFIEEVCKALIEDGVLYREAGHWRRPSMQEVVIPQSIRVAIQSRIGKLPAPVQDTLRLAAVIGREFDFETLRAVSELDEDDLFVALETAGRAQLVSEVRQPTTRRLPEVVAFTFAHALIPSTLLDGMSGLRRQRLHQRVAQALERLYPARLDELSSQLGKHFSAAGVWDKAADYWIKAGDQARLVYAYPEAVDDFQQAVAILKDQHDLPRAARTLMKLGMLHHLLSNFRQSRLVYQEAFALWQRAGEEAIEALPPAPHPLRTFVPRPKTLDPMLENEVGVVAMAEQLFSPLVALGPEMELQPLLARSWEILEGGRKYIFHLREDARWSDGLPVTAGDFEYSWRRALDPNLGSRMAPYLYDLRGARQVHKGKVSTSDTLGLLAPDDWTLVVELEAPAPYFLYLLTRLFPVPRHAVEKYGPAWADPQNIVTCGPFCLQDFQAGRVCTLRRDPNYTGRFTGNVLEAELLVLSDNRQTQGLYEAGRLDVQHLGATTPDADRLRRRYPGEFVATPGPGVGYLLFNPVRPPFKDLKVRRAFVMALDRETLAGVIDKGFTSPATGGFVPPSIPGHSADIGLPFDPPQAQRLLAEAGYPGGQGLPQIEALIGVLIGEVHRAARAFIQDQWKRHLGVDLRWEEVEFFQMDNRLKQEYPLLHYKGWVADYPDPHNFLVEALDIPTLSNWYLAFGELLDQARCSTNPDERLKLFQEADRFLIQQAALLPLTYGKWCMLVKPWVRRFPTNPVSWWMYKDVVLDPHE